MPREEKLFQFYANIAPRKDLFGLRVEIRLVCQDYNGVGLNRHPSREMRYVAISLTPKRRYTVFAALQWRLRQGEKGNTDYQG
jgi:hypothetical protein